MNLQEMQLLAQLIDGLEEAELKMEGAYKENNKPGFERAKKAVLDFQKQIASVIK